MKYDSMKQERKSHMRIRCRPVCEICGERGVLLYHSLKDYLFKVSGEWSFKKCPNPNCGLLWIDPLPTEEDCGMAYQNYYTHASFEVTTGSKPSIFDGIIRMLKRFNKSLLSVYLHRRYGYPKNYQDWSCFLYFLSIIRKNFYDAYVMYLPFIKNGRLLDVGSGSGELLARMDSLGWNVEGVEPDSSAVCLANRTLRLSIRCGTLDEQGYPDSCFDAITLDHVVEHVHNPLDLLKECYRILKPGGIIAVKTPNNASLCSRIFGPHWRGLEPPRHLQIFSSTSLKRVALAANFKISSLRSTVRGGYILSSSYALKKGTPFHSIIPQINRGYVVIFEILAMVEALIASVKPCIGEELVLVGIRGR